jgi:hypothetical protein
MPLPQPAILSGFHAWWKAHIDTPTHFPGVPLDTTQLSEWIELWVDAWSHQTRRATQAESIELTITAHVFVKASTNLARVHSLAQSIRTALEHQSIPLRDPVTSGHPLVGYAIPKEPEIRDLTRILQLTTPHLHHLVLTFPATAQPI